MVQCFTCDLLVRRDEGSAPLWDNIHRTLYWDVVHANSTSLPGWLVLEAIVGGKKEGAPVQAVSKYATSGVYILGFIHSLS